MKILGIDPGNVESGFALVETGASDIVRIIKHGKIKNKPVLALIRSSIEAFGDSLYLPIEMIQHYGQGMAAGATTFETCVWIGCFKQHAIDHGLPIENIPFIYRREEKINLCGSMKAKDKDIKTALCDRFTPGEPNFGKGTKQQPGFFYGMSKDAWQAFAVAVTFYDKHVRGVRS